jgi:hypothetical protein
MADREENINHPCNIAILFLSTYGFFTLVKNILHIKFNFCGSSPPDPPKISKYQSQIEIEENEINEIEEIETNEGTEDPSSDEDYVQPKTLKMKLRKRRRISKN